MESYVHSVQLDRSKCMGCTTCLHHCPTEAIRIRDGHAVIDENRCIDCGACIRVCPHHAKKAVSSKLDSMNRFKYKIALPAPTLYAQFENMDDVDYVLDGLLKIGFDDVYEVAKAAELVSAYTRRYIKAPDVELPVISSACPVVVRLISLMYPSLTGNIMRIHPPVQIAAREARKRAEAAHPELKPSDIGVCFISPCPAKVSYVNNYREFLGLDIDEVVSISEIYFELLNEMKPDADIQSLSDSGMIGISWAASGGESSAILNDNYLAADGIENVMHVLNQIENGNIPQVRFIELNACPGGCVGGVLTVQNPFIAKARLQSLRRYLPVSMNYLTPDQEQGISDSYMFDELPEYAPLSRLSSNMAESMRMMSDIQKLRDMLPGIDCGACGAPTCRALAEDAVRSGQRYAVCPIKIAREAENEGFRPVKRGV